MKLTEFLNAITKHGDHLTKSDVKSLLLLLNDSNINFKKELNLVSEDKATRHLVSNTENYTCFIIHIPSGIKCAEVASEYDNLVVLVSEGTLYIEKKKGAIDSSFNKTTSSDFRILGQGEVDVMRIPEGIITLSNPFSTGTTVVCIHLKDHNKIENEVSNLVKEFDTINGIKL